MNRLNLHTIYIVRISDFVVSVSEQKKCRSVQSIGDFVMSCLESTCNTYGP